MYNKNANHILEKNLDKIDWYKLCGACCEKRNPDAIKIIEKNMDKLDNNCWEELSRSQYAIHLLFKYDYELMSQKMWPFKEELLRYIFNPKRILNICDLYNIEFDELMEMYQLL